MMSVKYEGGCNIDNIYPHIPCKHDFHKTSKSLLMMQREFLVHQMK